MNSLARRFRPRESRRQAGSPRHRRAGFTLVELIVAIIILTVGVLGLASVSAVVMRQITGSSFQNRAAAIASSRFERLRSVSCAAAAGGTATSGGITERWTVQMLNRSMQIQDVVTWTERGRTRTMTFTTLRPCV